MKKLFIGICFLSYATSLYSARVLCKKEFFNTETLGLKSRNIPIQVAPVMSKFFSEHKFLFEKRNGVFYFPHYSIVIDALLNRKSLRKPERDLLKFLKKQNS